MTKKYFFGFLLLLSTGVQAQTTLSKTINVGGTNRSYRLYIPALYDGSEAVPLVFNFHGYGSNSQEQEFYGDFRPIADTANFILVHPQGLDLGGGAAGWNNFMPYSATNYDYTFVNELLDSLELKYNIDASRVYSTGMSNGGFMSYDLACFMSNRFAAVASVTGSMVASHLNACNPARVIPVMQIHGTNDPTVTYTGAGGLLTSTHIDTLVKFWAELNGCNLTPTMENVANTSTTDMCTAEHYTYTGGINGNTVEFFKIIGGQHTWPGTSFPTAGTNMDFKATKEIWRFFSKYSIENQSSGLEDLTNDFKIGPNPVETVLEMNWNGQLPAQLELRDLSGKLILEQLVSPGVNHLDFGKVANGLYLYNLLDVEEGKTLFSGKLYRQ